MPTRPIRKGLGLRIIDWGVGGGLVRGREGREGEDLKGSVRRTAIDAEGRGTFRGRS